MYYWDLFCFLVYEPFTKSPCKQNILEIQKLCVLFLDQVNFVVVQLCWCGDFYRILKGKNLEILLINSFTWSIFFGLKHSIFLNMAKFLKSEENVLTAAPVVGISWVSFWMDIESVPGRISLGVITLLSISNQASGEISLKHCGSKI